jgi:hypothetical protein
MQIIRPVPVDPEQYVREQFHKTIEPPDACPCCQWARSLIALGYYERYVTALTGIALMIFVRRFRCTECRGTTSVLPGFAQPYRLVMNSTIDQFFSGAVAARSLAWVPLLKQYWGRFVKWAPSIDPILAAASGRSPPDRSARRWWQVLIGVFGGMEKITFTLVSQYGVTLFGRYRCHSAFR